MKILFVQPYVTFTGVMNDTLPGQLARRNHEVLVATFSRHGIQSSDISNLKYQSVHGVSVSIPNFISEFPYLLNLDDVIKNFQPDIIHANNLPFLTTWQAARSAKRLGKRMVAHVHGVIGERTFLFNLGQKLFIYTFGRSIFSNADRLICLNESDAMEIKKYGAPPSKIVLIPNGVDVEKFHPKDSRMENSILWSGRFVKQKGLEYLIMAMDILVNKKGRSEVNLFLTGNGPLLPLLQAMVKRLGLERNVTFLGQVSREEVAKCMSTYSIYVLPSTSEGMPYALLEAMSSGMATIASNLPGIARIISQNETGILVPPKDPTSLAESIERLLNDKGLSIRLGKNARDEMVKEYDWSQVVTKVESLYRDITRSH